MTAQPQVTPTLAEINTCQEKINRYISTIDHHPDRRDGAYPYYLFHPAGEAIYGTILMFHGFSAKPHQMWRLADYLFQNGFNVYQVPLAGHSLIRPEYNWPQIDLKSTYKEPILEEVNQDPILSAFLNNIGGQSQPLSLTQKIALKSRLLKLNPVLLRDLVKALQSPNDPDFDRYFTSSHLEYLNDARHRLQELETLPGAIYTVGLSVGGAVALGLAEAEPERVKRVVAYAPLLNPVEDQGAEWQINLIGTLDIKDTGWDPNLQFPLGCFTATNRFGDYVRDKTNAQPLQNIPTFLVLTENEDAADVKTNQKFFQQIGGERKGHRSFLYDQGDLVPHPMIDPTEVSQGMSNNFWQSLYQETYRFLTTGEVVTENLDQLVQAPDLPTVPPV